jgi:hypothetical protein
LDDVRLPYVTACSECGEGDAEVPDTTEGGTDPVTGEGVILYFIDCDVCGVILRSVVLP